MNSIHTATTQSTALLKEKSETFQDLPIVDKHVRLTAIETKHSDKQIINEMVYRWCRIITRVSKRSLDLLAGPSDTTLQDARKALIIDLVGAINPIRLATVMKRDERRMRMIGIARGCKINSTFVTLNSYLGTLARPTMSSLKLVVIYQDEFFILKTITLLKECLKSMKCQFLLVVPRLDRQERDVISLISNQQILKCDFNINRREIVPAPPEFSNDSYQTYLNKIHFRRYTRYKALPNSFEGELREDGMYLFQPQKAIAKSKEIEFEDKAIKRKRSND